MEIKNYGKVSGLCKFHDYGARVNLHIIAPSLETKEEYEAVFALWEEEFGLKGVYWGYLPFIEGKTHPWIWMWNYQINTRREFSVLPAIIRKVCKLSYDIAVSLTENEREEIYFSQNPALFWQTIALAQMFYRD